MTEQPQLPMLLPLPTLHDMPPLWDGQPVEWLPWGEPTSTFICDRSKRTGSGLHTCDRCSAVMHRATFGKIDGTVRLIASRCNGCGLDTVVESGDAGMGAAWTLDYPDDYGDEGSVAP